MAYWQPVPGHAVPGAVLPHGYSRSWLPPAAAYSHSASLGKNPPSQMQNAYDSHQFTQFIGRFSLLLADVVHVAKLASHARLVFVGAMLLSSAVTPPVSYVPVSPLLASPWPPFRCVCLPEPADGSHP